jgi:hypothetical protein
LRINTLKFELIVSAPSDELEFAIIHPVFGDTAAAAPKELLCLVVPVTRPDFHRTGRHIGSFFEPGAIEVQVARLVLGYSNNALSKGRVPSSPYWETSFNGVLERIINVVVPELDTLVNGA